MEPPKAVSAHNQRPTTIGNFDFSERYFETVGVAETVSDGFVMACARDTKRLR